LPDWEKLWDQTEWGSNIKFGWTAYKKKLALVCRLLRRFLLAAFVWLFFSAFRAKLGSGRNPRAAPRANLKQDWLMQGCTAEVAVV
jgi:hypothetical protein